MKKSLRFFLLTQFFIFQYGLAKASPISEVRVIGAPTDWSENLKVMSGIIPGDEYEKTRLERSEEKLQAYLEGKGYPQVVVNAEAIERDGIVKVRFNVALGASIQIADVQFLAKGTGKEIPNALTGRLSRAIDLRVGELFDRDRIKDMRRAVETVLYSQNFIDSKIVDLTTEGTSQGLRLKFLLDIGQKVALSVSGNTYYSRTELMTFIDEQRAQGLGKEYVNILGTRLQDHYREVGFRSAKITPYSFESLGSDEKKVVFDIAEGPRFFIKELIFDGNTVFTSTELEEFYFKNASDRIVARIYNEKMAEDAATRMIDELKKRGYLYAKLIAIKTEDLNKSDVALRIFLNEGIQTRIHAIDFRGNRLFKSSQLIEFLGLHEGDPLSLVQLEDGIDQIKRQHRNSGYLNFKINNEAGNQLVSYFEKNQFADLSFEFEEGNQIHLAKIEIFGNDKTRRNIIERELRVKIGEPLSELKVSESEANLRRLGIFSQVNIEFSDNPTETNSKDMRVSVQEAVPGNSSIGMGFRNDLGLRVFGELSYANLWGKNHTWALDLIANRRLEHFRFSEYRAAVSYTWPWAFYGDTTFRPTLSAEKRQYLEFDAETYAISLNLDRMIYRPVKLSGGLVYTIEHVRQFDAVDLSQNQQIQIGSLTPVLRLDLRDNPLVPRKGFFAVSSFEYANSFMGSQKTPIPVSYGRFQSRMDEYLGFIPNVIWFNSLRGGWLKNFVDPYKADGSLDPSVTVPLIKQFALGGINSIRGFNEQELNVQAKNKDVRVKGYSTYINYRTQFDFFPTQALSFGPFLDAGNLQVDAFSLGNLRYGSGVGMRYLTPVGPVNFDWGFKLFPRSGEDANVFYFSLGVI